MVAGREGYPRADASGRFGPYWRAGGEFC